MYQTTWRNILKDISFRQNRSENTKSCISYHSLLHVSCFRDSRFLKGAKKATINIAKCNLRTQEEGSTEVVSLAATVSFPKIKLLFKFQFRQRYQCRDDDRSHYRVFQLGYSGNFK